VTGIFIYTFQQVKILLPTWNHWRFFCL